MATMNPPSVTSGAQAKSVTALRFAAQVAAGVLLLLGAAKVVTSILTIVTATLLALLGIVEGGLTVFLALILLKIATDLRFAIAAPSLTTTHLLNALDSWRDFCKTLIGLAVVAFLAAMLRFSM